MVEGNNKLNGIGREQYEGNWIYEGYIKI